MPKLLNVSSLAQELVWNNCIERFQTTRGGKNSVGRGNENEREKERRGGEGGKQEEKAQEEESNISISKHGDDVPLLWVSSSWNTKNCGLTLALR